MIGWFIIRWLKSPIYFKRVGMFGGPICHLFREAVAMYAGRISPMWIQYPKCVHALLIYHPPMIQSRMKWGLISYLVCKTSIELGLVRNALLSNRGI